MQSKSNSWHGLKPGAVVLAVMALMGTQKSLASEQGVGFYEGVAGLYGDSSNSRGDVRPIDMERQVTIKSPTTIQGCNDGLILVQGAYTCRSLAPVSQGGTVPDRLYTGGSSGGSFSGSGGALGGFLGSDGVSIHAGPSDSSPVIGFVGEVRQIGTTDQRDQRQTEARNAEAAAEGRGGGGSEGSSVGGWASVVAAIASWFSGWGGGGGSD